MDGNNIKQCDNDAPVNLFYTAVDQEKKKIINYRKNVYKKTYQVHSYFTFMWEALMLVWFLSRNMLTLKWWSKKTCKWWYIGDSLL